MARLYFDELGAAIRWTEQARTAAEPFHLQHLVTFAERAYRRPLSPAERRRSAGVLSHASPNGLGHEDAIRDTVASVLVSPHVLYRVDASRVYRAVAYRRSRCRAADWPTRWPTASVTSCGPACPTPNCWRTRRAATCTGRDVLRAQVRRMLRDERVSRLAVEFGTNWLGVRRFEEYNSVDRERFPAFSNELRQAFFEEPVRFLTAMIREDRPVMISCSATTPT